MVVELSANWWDQDDATALRIGSYPPDSRSAIANLLAGRHPQDLIENRYNTLPGFYFKFRDLKNNFQQTNLSNAKLIGANLANANLQQANLMGTNLNSANLTNTCLFDTILTETDKKLAIDNGALFSKDSFQRLKYLRSLPPQASQ
ncbi:pentapeptide repeat-containing protein [Nostoc sp.]